MRRRMRATPFMALGYGAIGWSMFGIDLTGYANAPLGAAQIDDKLIDRLRAGL